MQRHGFIGFPTEGGHFDLQGWEKYPPLNISLQTLARAAPADLRPGGIGHLVFLMRFKARPSLANFEKNPAHEKVNPEVFRPPTRKVLIYDPALEQAPPGGWSVTHGLEKLRIYPTGICSMPPTE